MSERAQSRRLPRCSVLARFLAYLSRAQHTDFAPVVECPLLVADRAPPKCAKAIADTTVPHDQRSLNTLWSSIFGSALGVPGAIARPARLALECRAKP
jgi:hypothetical protein